MISSDHQLTIKQQCKLLNINRATYYYKPNNALDENDLQIMTAIDELYTMHPYFGTRRMAKYLQKQGFNIERKGIRRYYRIMGLEAVYPKMNLKKLFSSLTIQNLITAFLTVSPRN